MLTSSSQGFEKSQDTQVTMGMAGKCKIALEEVEYLPKRYQIQS